MMPNTDRFRPPSAHDEIARCASCDEKFHYTQLDDYGFCPTCRPQANEDDSEKEHDE